MRYLGVKVEEELLKLLAERARAEGVPVSEVVRRAIRAYLGLPLVSTARVPEDVASAVEDVRREVKELKARLEALERIAESLKARTSPNLAKYSKS